MEIPAGTGMDIIRAIDNEGQRIRNRIDDYTNIELNHEREEYITFLDRQKKKLLAVVKVK